MRLLLAVVLLALTLAGLGWWVLGLNQGATQLQPRLDANRQRPQGDYYVGAYEEPKNFNPFTSLDSVVNGGLLPYTHDGLLGLDPSTLATTPALASIEERAADGRSCVLRLRDDLRWSDGTPLTTADVAFTYATLRDATGRMAQAAARLQSLDVLDARRLRLTLREVHFAGLDAVATELRPLQQRWWQSEVARLAQAAGAAVPAPGTPDFGRLVGQVALPGPASGPYQVAVDAASGTPSWRRHEELVLVQNPHSWRRAAEPEHWNLAGSKMRFLADPAATRVALRNQQLDWTVVGSDPQKILAGDPELAQHFQALTYDYVKLGQYVVMWNCRRPALADARVRRALTMLFDRQTLVARVLEGVAVPALGWFKSGTPEYPRDLRPIAFDPIAARALLQEAGFDADRPLRVSMLRGNDPLHNRIMDLARPAFEQAGVELIDVVRSYEAYSVMRDARDFDGVLATVSHGVWIDPYDRFHSSQSERGENFMGYANAEVDRLLEQARTELDGEQRAALYRRFGEILHDEQPVTLLAHPLVGLLLHRRFEGVEIGRLGLRFDTLWVPQAAQLHN